MSIEPVGSKELDIEALEVGAAGKVYGRNKLLHPSLWQPEKRTNVAKFEIAHFSNVCFFYEKHLEENTR